MSTYTNISVEQFQQLASLVETLKADVDTLVGKFPNDTKTVKEKLIKFSGSKGKYCVFSNLYKHPIKLDNIEYPTVEHYLAYQKFVNTDKEYADSILEQKKAAVVTNMAITKKHVSRDDWNTVSTEFLTKALNKKFEDNNLRSILVETGNTKIVFENKKDNNFGVGSDGTGKNILGKALMNLRKSLLKQE
jgi:ribA/ribD-fused uncharacterized protein